jgi:hypothetical protein
MNGTIERQAELFGAKARGPNRPTLMEDRQAEKCIGELEKLADAGLTIEQVEHFLRALAVLRV